MLMGTLGIAGPDNPAVMQWQRGLGISHIASNGTRLHHLHSLAPHRPLILTPQILLPNTSCADVQTKGTEMSKVLRQLCTIQRDCTQTLAV